MKNRVRNALRTALLTLVELDGSLFSAQIEPLPAEHSLSDALEPDYGPRKLHEVCLNHSLARHIGHELNPILRELGQHMFVDLEFTRNGPNPKELIVDGENRIVRPDIIVHNRRDGVHKLNFLVVECKKLPCSDGLLATDEAKLRGFLTDPRYLYRFGLQVIYGDRAVTGVLFCGGPNRIETETI